MSAFHLGNHFNLRMFSSMGTFNSGLYMFNSMGMSNRGIENDRLLRCWRRTVAPTSWDDPLN